MPTSTGVPKNAPNVGGGAADTPARACAVEYGPHVSAANAIADTKQVEPATRSRARVKPRHVLVALGPLMATSVLACAAGVRSAILRAWLPKDRARG